MAMVFANLHRAVRSSSLGHTARSCRSQWSPRAIHSTPVVLKKKQKGVAQDADDFFDSIQDDSGSLFPTSSANILSDETPTKPTQHHAPSTLPQGIPFDNPSLPASSQFDRSARFNRLFQFAEACLVTKTEPKRQPRNAIWSHLINLATSPEQLERVIDILPSWRQAKRTFTPQTAIAFARRCLSLKCPELALKVFGDHPKYGLDLTLDASRLTLCALQTTHSVRDCITFASLFSIYKLPPVSSDLVCTTALVQACLKADEDKEDTTSALTIARAMLPSLRTLLKSTPPEVKMQPRDKTWLNRALNDVRAALQKQGIKHGWLDEWLIASGCLRVA